MTKGADTSIAVTAPSKSITLKGAFKLFNIIYEVITDSLALRRVIREALVDAYDDNVVYLELRTAPRPLTDQPTRRDYVDILVEEVDRWRDQESQHHRRMDIRLILGIDRAGTIKAAEEIVKLAIAWRARRPDLFVGMDVAGNPIKGDTRDFIPLLERARCHGLKITAHVAEVPNRDDETDAVLSFQPDRLGHALWVSEKQKDTIVDKNIGIEICPTSNKCTLQLKSLSQHPYMQTWLSIAHKWCILIILE
ncbi:adenosine deaminase, putative [Perkinsus marinus ATCC 50983]|uniref:Adenosine deaminase, putative n=1 Tax=Perkinsus marinus (strain ATCC 50983 / TXsc) TaxID=423536 RepID=C5LQ39_PERM5|nr:adenosine deaminase, putative [Perkinsus marinus ATCC 50983]EER01147.1 adenosine deaminase, putative [Perkinsus marinus ATCC 50983]|eukprot:XP_002768429.1 adenosine deaminase, putative [Perkinsus marinus ATCC 50983]